MLCQTKRGSPVFLLTACPSRASESVDFVQPPTMMHSAFCCFCLSRCSRWQRARAIHRYALSTAHRRTEIRTSRAFYRQLNTRSRSHSIQAATYLANPLPVGLPLVMNHLIFAVSRDSVVIVVIEMRRCWVRRRAAYGLQLVDPDASTKAGWGGIYRRLWERQSWLRGHCW
jgi:hypothetical protein